MCAALRKSGKVLYEVVAWRYSDEQGVMLVGEAEVMVEQAASAQGDVQDAASRYHIRVDVLSAFDPEGQDCFAAVMRNEALRTAIEAAALDHFLMPPQMPVSLPRNRMEW